MEFKQIKIKKSFRLDFSTTVFSLALVCASISANTGYALDAHPDATALSSAEQSTSTLSQTPSVTPAVTLSSAGLSKGYETAALIYNGASTATGDPEAITEILDQHGITHQIVSSKQLNAMSLEDFSKFGVIIWPGGYAGYMSASLLASTRALIRQAVTERGVSYVGFCAGAFMAVTPPAQPGEDGPAWGLSLISGDLLPYYHLEDEGIEYSMVKLKLADESIRSLVWWGGPTLTEVPHGVIARYLDTGQPAITETWAGKGLVLLSGPHPEAPQEWRTKLGLVDPEGLQQDIAWKMFEAAITRQPMPALN